MLTKFYFSFTTLLISIFLNASVSAATPKSKINWQTYQKAAFINAQQENKFLLLDLKAVWCHWCHVMDQKTYQNQQVTELINRYFIPVKVDHDARPDLAERYRDWGWPATIIFHADGTEIIKRAGYISPDKMVDLLETIIEDPSPERGQLSYPKQINSSPDLDGDTKRRLQQRHLKSFDNTLGGLDIAQKFIEEDSLRWDMTLAQRGDKKARERAILTLDQGLNLIDPAFGGVYQYSTHGDWKHPHYEKIMKIQARYMRTYALAYQQFKNTQYLKAAEKIADYLNTFLSDADGAFYNSQDADLKQGKKGHDYFALSKKERLKKGIPYIDKSQYAGENADAADAFLVLYKVSREQRYLERAEKALAWILKNRRLGIGGYRHDQQDFAGPYLSDTLNTGQAFLRYYQITGNHLSLQRAEAAADFMHRHFVHPSAGLLSAADNGTPIKPLPQIDQNIRAGLFLLNLYQETNSLSNLAAAESVLRYLNSPEIALSRLTEAGLLRLDDQYQLIRKSLQE